MTKNEIDELHNLREDIRKLDKLIEHSEKGYWVGVGECDRNVSPFYSEFVEGEFIEFLRSIRIKANNKIDESVLINEDSSLYHVWSEDGQYRFVVNAGSEHDACKKACIYLYGEGVCGNVFHAVEAELIGDGLVNIIEQEQGD